MSGLLAARLLALDVGSKRIGVAVSDHSGKFAFPLITLETQGPLQSATQIAALMKKEEAHGVVVGLPAHADGSESSSAKRARRLGDALKQLGVEIDYMDEWGTSLDARDALAHMSKKARQDKGIVDQAAAVSILTAYLQERAAKTRDTASTEEA